mmetsp:Transcript_88340/g.258210  ORF Transcript_88340/g.258210 Transcript_88340/m.258210 type:complete len:215 (-) Transcript_88340:2819-3463(-)
MMETKGVTPMPAPTTMMGPNSQTLCAGAPKGPAIFNNTAPASSILVASPCSKDSVRLLFNLAASEPRGRQHVTPPGKSSRAYATTVPGWGSGMPGPTTCSPAALAGPSVMRRRLSAWHQSSVRGQRMCTEMMLSSGADVSVKGCHSPSQKSKMYCPAWYVKPSGGSKVKWMTSLGRSRAVNSTPGCCWPCMRESRSTATNKAGKNSQIHVLWFP